MMEAMLKKEEAKEEEKSRKNRRKLKGSVWRLIGARGLTGAQEQNRSSDLYHWRPEGAHGRYLGPILQQKFRFANLGSLHPI